MKKKLFLIVLILIILLIVFINAQISKKNNDLLDFEINELSSTSTLKQLDLDNMYDYNMFYYGISEVILYYNNQTLNLETALKENIITMDEIIEKSEEYAAENKIVSEKYLDGGTTIYRYKNITIIKYNTESTNNRDVYIGDKNMNLDDIRDLNSTLAEDNNWLYED